MTATPTEFRSLSDEDLAEGIRDALSYLHRGAGVPEGETLDGCPGCEAQMLFDELVFRFNRAKETA